MSRVAVALVPVLLLASTGCGRAGLSAPFDKMKDQPITVLRLQNYEPKPQGAAAPAAPPMPLPPQLQQWLTAGASMLPPGLIPLLNAGQPQPGQQEAKYFHNFRVLGWMALTDPSQRQELLDIFGTERNFTDSRANCPYSEFGVSIGQPSGQPPAEMLVSLSCDRVQAFNFPWPYSKAGLQAETVKRIVAVMARSFGG